MARPNIQMTVRVANCLDRAALMTFGADVLAALGANVLTSRHLCRGQQLNATSHVHRTYVDWHGGRGAAHSRGADSHLCVRL